jgi:hypothetical protein
VDYVLEEQFQAVLKEAIQELFPLSMAVLSRHSVYFAARGATETAQRVWWRYHHTKAMIEQNDIHNGDSCGQQYVR